MVDASHLFLFRCIILFGLVQMYEKSLVSRVLILNLSDNKILNNSVVGIVPPW